MFGIEMKVVVDDKTVSYIDFDFLCVSPKGLCIPVLELFVWLRFIVGIRPNKTSEKQVSTIVFLRAFPFRKEKCTTMLVI